jgi:hypothetical protein
MDQPNRDPLPIPVSPFSRHRPRQLLQLHALRLPAFEDRLLDIRRQQGEPKQAIDEAAVDLLGLSDLGRRTVPPLGYLRPLAAAGCSAHF